MIPSLYELQLRENQLRQPKLKKPQLRERLWEIQHRES